MYLNGAILGLSKKEIDAQFDEIGDSIDAPVDVNSSGVAA